MNEHITIQYKGNYIHARQSGPDSYDASLELWKRIVAACEEHHCFNVLGETFTTRQLSTREAFDHIIIFELAGVTLKYRIAWVHHSDDPDRTMEFTETVLRNRGVLNGALFPTVEKALDWLLEDSMDNEPDAGDRE